ncbi:uncharacterized protein LOC133492810 isoform X3 [Syngnathoides biaculeatus]|uniref:uncharacterized protein LOC133492810 isoform X3 n=1 Tax=Syngnathoides biaculeatus TaxID=300417 RepID=UPI002ADE4742|nr:uncharacterized protein LOC133492810 isoform X3 [Syngnathoides biaculeatus]
MTPGMPFLKKARLNLPRSTILDNKAKKSGLRGTVFAVNGDNYTGEWLDNKKHGWGTQEWKSTGAIYNGEWKFGKHDGYGIFSILRPETKKDTAPSSMCMQLMKESGVRTIATGGGDSPISVAISTRGSGSGIRNMEQVLFNLPMETGTKDLGSMARKMVTESSTMPIKVSFMKACGWTATQNAGLCLILGEKKHHTPPSIQFLR